VVAKGSGKHAACICRKNCIQKIKEVFLSEMLLLTYQTAWHNPEHHSTNIHCYADVKHGCCCNHLIASAVIDTVLPFHSRENYTEICITITATIAHAHAQKPLDLLV
jgi:hypothetical protein